MKKNVLLALGKLFFTKYEKHIQWENRDYGDWYTPDTGEIRWGIFNFYGQWEKKPGNKETYQMMGQTKFKQERAELKYFRISNNGDIGLRFNMGTSGKRSWFYIHPRFWFPLKAWFKRLSWVRNLTKLHELGWKQYHCNHDFQVTSNINGDSGSETFHCPKCGFRQHIQYY